MERVEIVVKDHLNRSWDGFIEGYSVEFLDNGTTVISGLIVDQAQLFSICSRIRALGVKLIKLEIMQDE